jgi:hypothetical protein
VRSRTYRLIALGYRRNIRRETRELNMTKVAKILTTIALLLSFSFAFVAPAAAVEGFDNFDARACYCTDP